MSAFSVWRGACTMDGCRHPSPKQEARMSTTWSVRPASRILALTAIVATSMACGAPDDDEGTELSDEALAGCPCSVWTDTTVPKMASASDSAAVELGVKFKSDVKGTIT